MKTIRRILIIPALLALVIALLVLADFISVETDLPLQSIAFYGAMIAGGLFVLLALWEGVATVRSWQLPEPEEPPTYEGVIEPKPLENSRHAIEVEVIDSIEKAEDFSKRANDRVRIAIDIEEAQED